ncbi:hypothetical protein OG801_27375 [Nocardioides sp. NBC_00163]|uniref:hypothetical protein n=1 Tax=Nocardioides sp. NBC_00163 TaxID=2975999 RepID=UPI00324993B6
MTDEDALFQLFDDPSSETIAQPSVPQPIAAWQISQIRAALDSLGTTDMSERREQVEAVVGRPVAALGELMYDDVRPLLEGLHARRAASGASTTSAWDERDEETWIDRL